MSFNTHTYIYIFIQYKCVYLQSTIAILTKWYCTYAGVYWLHLTRSTIHKQTFAFILICIINDSNEWFNKNCFSLSHSPIVVCICCFCHTIAVHCFVLMRSLTVYCKLSSCIGFNQRSQSGRKFCPSPPEIQKAVPEPDRARNKNQFFARVPI